MSKTLKKILYLVLGLISGVIVWFVTELQMTISGGDMQIRILVMGGLIGSVYGFFLGSAEGIALSIKKKTLHGGMIGLGVGAAAGTLAVLISQSILLAVSSSGKISMKEMTETLLPPARAGGWILLGTLLGSIEGIRSRSLRRILFGITGGAAGGLIGGVLLELMNSTNLPLSLLRLPGFLILGGILGTSLSLADAFGRIGILKVMNGRFKGKDFIIVKRNILIGASPGCDITVPEDSRMESHHARIYKKDGAVYIKKTGTGKLEVNDVETELVRLKYEDILRCGQTVLRFVP